MNKFPKLVRRSPYPTKSRYREYRSEIRDDCQCRCVYCNIHHDDIGGEEVMTIDHFRPKDKYPQLENDPTNLLWACHTCNHQKDNDWPAYQHNNGTIYQKRGYIDPFATDRDTYFVIHTDSGEIHPRQPPAAYMIKKLNLNRQFLKMQRIRYYLKDRIVKRVEKGLDRVSNKLSSLENSDGSDQTIEEVQQDLQTIRDLIAQVVPLLGPN